MKIAHSAQLQLRSLATILSASVLLIFMASAGSAQTNPEPNPARNAYFGELHIHSDWSIDAYVFGTRLGPQAEIKYAMGLPVLHPGGFRVHLSDRWTSPS